MSITNFLVGAVKVFHIVFVNVGRGNVGAPAKPPLSALTLKEAVIKVHGGAMGIAWMHDATESTGTEFDLFLATPLLFGGGPEGRLGHVPVDDAEIDAGLFPDISVGQDATGPAPARGTHPRIFAERCAAVNVGNLTRNVNLGLTEHLFHLDQHFLVVTLKVGNQFGETQALGRFLLFRISL